MKYTLQELMTFMESAKKVRVTCTDGTAYTGRCWAYSAGTNLEEFGVDDHSVEIGDTQIYLKEINTIEYAD